MLDLSPRSGGGSPGPCDAGDQQDVCLPGLVYRIGQEAQPAGSNHFLLRAPSDQPSVGWEGPGAKAFTVIPVRASSTARLRVSCTTAPVTDPQADYLAGVVLPVDGLDRPSDRWSRTG